MSATLMGETPGAAVRIPMSAAIPRINMQATPEPVETAPWCICDSPDGMAAECAAPQRATATVRKATARRTDPAATDKGYATRGRSLCPTGSRRA
jgi:hypothetical protein